MTVLAANAQVAYSGISSALAARAAGYFIANIFGAILQNIVKKHSEGLLTCAFFLPAIGKYIFNFQKGKLLLVHVHLYF